jgi:GntR family transcriptional repressor for pyruvate dehydrogenase complex
LKPPRMAEVVAGILRERIIDGQLGDGDLLPKQDELLEEFRISRPSMREALRILEDEGLLTVRRGNQGGSVIEVPTAETSAYTFGLVLQSRRSSIADLAAAIRHIEPITAALCAQREDREESVLPALQASLAESAEAIGDDDRFTTIARSFHERMVGCCGNETLGPEGQFGGHLPGRDLPQGGPGGACVSRDGDQEGPGGKGKPSCRSAP